jgi:hypothetical protein
MSDEIKHEATKADFKKPDHPIKFGGHVPQQMLKALNKVRAEKEGDKQYAEESNIEPTPHMTQARVTGSPQLEDLIAGLRPTSLIFEEITLPSKGIFYNGKDGPKDGILHIRPMTGEEEQILATPRYIRRGQAINMIFQRCIQEGQHRPEDFLAADRQFILIWLRGISYSPEYDVEIKCPECERKFEHKINLSLLRVTTCPNDFNPPLIGTLPKSGYKFEYRLPRGKDEIAIQEHRDRHQKMFGDAGGADDSLIYRSALLLDNIEGLKDKRELLELIKKLPIQDVAHIRNLTSEPPFGVNTKSEVMCPYASCLADFDAELPLESGFFFPRPKRTENSA